MNGSDIKFCGVFQHRGILNWIYKEKQFPTRLSSLRMLWINFTSELFNETLRGRLNNLCIYLFHRLVFRLNLILTENKYQVRFCATKIYSTVMQAAAEFSWVIYLTVDSP